MLFLAQGHRLGGGPPDDASCQYIYGGSRVYSFIHHSKFYSKLIRLSFATDLSHSNIYRSGSYTCKDHLCKVWSESIQRVGNKSVIFARALFRETSHFAYAKFRENKILANSEITLSFTDLGKSCPSREF